jgi:hypothetical protein
MEDFFFHKKDYEIYSNMPVFTDGKMTDNGAVSPETTSGCGLVSSCRGRMLKMGSLHRL